MSATNSRNNGKSAAASASSSAPVAPDSPASAAAGSASAASSSPNTSGAAPQLSQEAVLRVLKEAALESAAAERERIEDKSGKLQFDSLLNALKKQTSKQFARQMHAIRILLQGQDPIENVRKLLDVYAEWIKEVEEAKGKHKEANEAMKERLRKAFPVDKHRSTASSTADFTAFDHEMLWEILAQKEILHCPMADHWEMTNHELESCYFNLKSNKSGDIKPAGTQSGNTGYTGFQSNKRMRGYSNVNAPYNPYTGAAMSSPTGVAFAPPMLSNTSGWQQNAPPMALAHAPPTVQPYTSYHGAAHPMMGHYAAPSYNPMMFREPCGGPTPAGPCTATNHRPYNCPWNPRLAAAHAQQAAGNSQSINQQVRNESGFDLRGVHVAGDVKESDVETNTCTRFDSNAMAMASCSAMIAMSVNIDHNREPEARSDHEHVHHNCYSASSCSGTGNGGTGMRVVWQPGPSGLAMPTTSNKLLPVKDKIAQLNPQDDSVHDIVSSKPHRTDSESEESLLDLYMQMSTSDSVSTVVTSENINPHEEESIQGHSLSEQTALKLDKPHTALLTHNRSLNATMRHYFSGRKGKKIYSDEQLASLHCRHCNTKGHTITSCPNLHDKSDTEHPWLSELLKRPAFHVERLTKGNNWSEIESVLEREGEEANKGNPWQGSMLRKDSLRKNLGYWYVIGANPTVLSWIGNGVPTRFLTPPASYAFHNHEESLKEHEEFIEAEHKLHEEDGSFIRMTAEHKPPKVLNPLMVAVNKKGKPRLCHDLRWPNGFLPHIDFKMETLQSELPDVVTQGDSLLSIDISKAYYSVPMHPDAQPFLCWEWGGSLWMTAVLVFGLSTAPLVFTKIMRPWMAFLRGHGVKMLGMIDDYMFSVEPKQAKELAKFIRFSLTRLGWQLNDKCQLTPQPRVKILGMIVDSEKMMVYAPDEKLKEAKELTDRILKYSAAGQWIDVSWLQQLCGKLMSMVLALPGVRVFTRALYALIARALEEARIPRFKVWLWEQPGADEELTFWSRRLCNEFNGLPIQSRGVTLRTHVWVDAGDIGWGGEILDRQYSGVFAIEEIGRSSTRRELVGLLSLLTEAIEFARGHHIHIYMDSYAAIRNLINGGGPKQELTEAVKQWFRFCEQHKIIATYEWIPREQNTKADRYSKLAAQDYHLCDGVERYVRNWLTTICPNTNRTEHMAIFIPEFSVIPLRLESILLNMGEAILIIPHWPGQSWWPTLIANRTASCYLGDINKVLHEEWKPWSRPWKMEAHWIRGRRKIASVQ